MRLQDVVDYQDSQRATRRAALDGMTRDAVDAGLYDTVPDYTQALADSRHEHAQR